MAYILFISNAQAEVYQAQADELLGYPESEDQFTQEGSPSHASWQLGRAMHYAPIMFDADNIRVALPKVDGIATPEGSTEIAELPSDWYPPAPELE